MKNKSDSKLPSFSILMANYNNGDYIAEAIESVLSQTYPSWELIIVDDASTDDSIQKITQYLRENRIKLIKHEKNLGYGGTLKTAAENATNDILAVFDSDDKLHENALKIMAHAYENNPKYGFIYSTYWVCDSTLRNGELAKLIGPVNSSLTNLKQNIVSHLKTFRRDIYLKTAGFDPNLRIAVDKDIIFKIEEKTMLKFVNKPLYYYRQHKKGVSQFKKGYEVGIEYYIARLKAYRRRINTKIPNLRKRDLYLDLLKIRIYRLAQLLAFINTIFNFSILIERILNLNRLPRKIKEIIGFLDKILKFP